MSRTPKRGKSPGFELWSKRPGPSRAPAPGRWSKTITHRNERRAAKAAVRKVDRQGEK
jgi:hypothetical protein